MIKIGGGGAKRHETHHHRPGVEKIHAYVEYSVGRYLL